MQLFQYGLFSWVYCSHKYSKPKKMLALHSNICFLQARLVYALEPLLTNSPNYGYVATIKKISIIKTKLLVSFGPVYTFFTSERGIPLHYSKNGLSSKMSITGLFHCKCLVLRYGNLKLDFLE